MLNDDGKLKQKFRMKEINSHKEGIGFYLSYEEFCSLLREAGIVSSDLGISKYHLSRNNDEGEYKIGNCKFKWYLDNASERKTSEKMLEASRKNVKCLLESFNSKESLKKREKSLREYHKVRKIKAIEKRKEFEEKAHPSYLGSKNSQYGSFWITNGIENKKWHRNKGSIPDSYYKGRVGNFRRQEKGDY